MARKLAGERARRLMLGLSARRLVLVAGLLSALLVLPLLVLAAWAGEWWPVALAVPLASAIVGVMVLSVQNWRMSRSLQALKADMSTYWALPRPAGATTVLPRLGDSAIDPDLAHALAEICILNPLEAVVELGPGSSTVILDMALSSASSTAELIGVEHDAFFARRVELWLEYLGITRARVVVAPLVEQHVDDWTGRWYAPSVLDHLPPAIDLLLVDGPPAYEVEKGAISDRYPAYPLLKNRLKVGSFVVLDDVDRPGEEAVLERWLESSELEISDRQAGFVILRFVGSR